MEIENEGLTIEGLQESFGITPGTPAPAATDPVTTEPDADPANTETDPQGENNPAPPADPQPSTEPQKPTELPVQPINRGAYAFAEMRKTISEQNKLLQDLGAALGLKGKPDEIVAGLKKAAAAQQAKEQNIPVEIMERLNALEQEKAEREARDHKVQVYAAINTFQRNMGIDQRELTSFLTQLAQAGKNPFEQNIDLRAEYLVMNFEKLAEQRVQEALEKQAKLDNKARAQSTNPGTQKGGGEPTKREVKTMDDLDAFLRTAVKG